MSTEPQTYQSKSARIRAMRWTVDLGGGLDAPDGDDAAAHQRMVDSWVVGGADRIVHWVNSSGGMARYVANRFRAGDGSDAPGIDLRTINGWASMPVGHYAMEGSSRFCPHEEYGQPGHQCAGIVDFYPCDPETFERRWRTGGTGTRVRAVFINSDLDRRTVDWPEGMPLASEGAMVTLRAGESAWVRSVTWCPEGVDDDPQPEVYIVLTASRPR